MRVRQLPWTRVRAFLATTVATLAMAALTTGLIGVPADADPRSDKEKADRAVRALRQELTESSAKFAMAEAAYAAAEAQLAAAKAELLDAKGAVLAAKAREAELAERVVAAVAAEQQAEQALADINEDVEASEADLGMIVRQAYQQGPMPELVLAFDAESMRDYADQMAYLDQIATSQNHIIRRLRNERAAAASAAKMLEQLRQEVVDQREAAAKQVEERAAAEAAAEAAAAQVEVLTEERAAAKETAERERDEDLRRYREMQEEAERLAELVAAEIAKAAAAGQRPRASTPKRSSGAVLAYPVNGPVTSPFGMRYHPILKYRKLHTGTDFGSPSGTRVRAARAGKVIQSGWSSGYGNRVVISHGYVDGVHLVTTYNHLSSRSASVGERMSEGELVGRVGSTGYSTGPHLHFEVMVNGEFRNPMNWLR